MTFATTIVGSTAPAGASASSGLEFEGTASLPAFPCPLTVSCEGTFEGTASGELAGDDGGATWQATLTTAELTAEFGYEDANCTDGSARGTASITAGFGDVYGTYDDEPVPRSVHRLEVDATFSWDRDGSAADLDLRDVEVRLDVESLGWQQVTTTAAGAAVATFAPLLDPMDLPDCTTEDPDPPPLDAEVVGAATFSDSL